MNLQIKRTIDGQQQQLQVIETQQQIAQGQIVQEGQYDVENNMIFEEEEVGNQNQNDQKQSSGPKNIQDTLGANSIGQQNYLNIVPLMKNQSFKNKNRVYPQNDRVIVQNAIPIQNNQKNPFSNNSINNQFSVDIERPAVELQGYIKTCDQEKKQLIEEETHSLQYKAKAQQVSQGNSGEINQKEDVTAKVHPERPQVFDGNYIPISGTNRISEVSNRSYLQIVNNIPIKNTIPIQNIIPIENISPIENIIPIKNNIPIDNIIPIKPFIPVKSNFTILLPVQENNQQPHDNKIKDYLKCLKELIIFIITFIEVILTIVFWFIGFKQFEVEEIERPQNQTHVFFILQIIYVSSISLTIFLHIVSWVHIGYYIKNKQQSCLENLIQLYVSVLMGFFCYFKFTPLFYYYFLSNRNSHQLSYNQVEKYFSYSKYQNPTILFKKHKNKEISIFKDFIYLRIAKFSMMLMVVNQTIPQIFLQLTFSIYFEQWGPFNLFSLIIMVCSSIQGICLLIKFLFRQLKNNFNQIPQLSMNQIVIQSEYEVKQLSKAIKHLQNKNVKFFISSNLKEYVKTHEVLKNLVQIEYFENENFVIQHELDINKLKQPTLVVKKQPYYFYQENSPRASIGSNNNIQENEQSQDINEQCSIIRESIYQREQINEGIYKKCIMWYRRQVYALYQIVTSNSLIKIMLLILIALWSLLFFILQPVIFFLTKNMITKVSSAFFFLNILIKFFWFFFFHRNNQPPNFSLLENSKLSLLLLCQRILGLWGYVNEYFPQFQMKTVKYDLKTYQNFKKYVIKYQKFLALSKLQDQLYTISNKTPFIYQTQWRDQVFMALCKIIIIYGNLFIINEEFPIILPILLSYQIYEELFSNYFLITEAIIENVIPAFILSQKTFNHFLQSMMIFIDFSGDVQIENPQFIKKLNKLNEEFFQQYPIEINVPNITNINDQILKTFNHLKIVELKQSESFLHFGADDNLKILNQLKISKIFDLKLNFNLGSNNFDIEKLNQILQNCPQTLSFLHISIEKKFSIYNFDLQLNHLQNLSAFKFTFIQNQTNNFNSAKPIIEVNESFLNLDKVDFKILNIELNGCLTLTGFPHFFNQFIQYEELYLKLVAQDYQGCGEREIIFDELNFSENLNSLTLFFQNVSLKFGQNFGKITKNLKYFKFITINCHFNMKDFRNAILEMNKESQIIIDFTQQSLDETDSKRTNELKENVSQKN